VALRIVETALGPILIDENDAQRGAPTRLEVLAEELGVDAGTYRGLLRDEIKRRRREVGAAWEGLDRTLQHREETGGSVASNGDNPEASRVHHQEHI